MLGAFSSRTDRPSTVMTKPELRMILAPGRTPARGLGFRLPVVPGVPDAETQLAAGIRLAAESPAFATLPEIERDAALAGVAEAFSRARYHKLRFDELVENMKARRHALGGPVVADLHVAPSIMYEA